MKKNKKAKLVLSALSIAISGALLSSVHASDLEIYHHHTIAPQSPSQPSTPPPSTAPTSSKSKPVLMVVLNIGPGMGLEDGSFGEDYGPRIGSTASCRKNSSANTQSKSVTLSGSGKTVYYKYETCKGKPTRVSVIKEAFLKFLADPDTQIQKYKKDNNIQSDFNSIKDFKIGLASNFSFDGNGGYIAYPAMEMTDDNRYKLAQAIAEMDADTKQATPLALTIAETMAYFAGGTTANGSVTQVAFPVGVSTSGRWQGECMSSNAVRELYAGRFDIEQYCPPRKAIPGLSQQQAEAKYPSSLYTMITQSAGRNTYHIAKLKTGSYYYSGFLLSHPDSKSGDKYISPLSKDNECGANGIYMLSDGDVVDNISSYIRDSSSMYQATLTNALLNQPANIEFGGSRSSNVCQGSLRDTRTKKRSLGSSHSLPIYWSCAGVMAKAARTRFDRDGKIIRNQSFTVKKDGETFNADVRFASVGYGGAFKQLQNAIKSPVTVTLPGGLKKGIKMAYNCDQLTDEQARNMCRLGEFGKGYGEGGFYYVAPEDNSAVAESIMNFMFSLTPLPPDSAPPVVYPEPDRTPVSTGAMTTPIDPLTGRTGMGFAYLPILDPMPGVTTLWNGNLKKYSIKNGKMMGKNNVPVIKDIQGHFSTNSYDYWNKDSQADNAEPQKGGAYSQLFNPPSTTRTIFTEGRKDGQLALVQLTSSNINSKIAHRSDKSTLTHILQQFINDSNKKVHGAVLHSRPQLVTYEINITDKGVLDSDSNNRKDYVLYGSMDGALHLVDSNTGQEKFAFIPEEILDLQPNALIKESANDSKVPYGVDGAWSVHTNYVIAGDKYQANKMIASGGLRMGGSKYYGIDITNPESLAHLYTVGSNYGKKLQTPDTTLQGSGGKSDAENTAYARMGQSWAKPSVGYVRSGNKKIMVNFLAGGYDMGYEEPNYAPSDAQGNAVYMVQVGEERVNSLNQIEINPTNSGKLLWWVTKGAGRDQTSSSTNLQASQVSEMNHSVVSQIRVLDRDNDGYTDHIYYADLGGRVWRVDIDNTANMQNFSVTRVVKVLDVSDQKSGNDKAPRFYESPLVTFTKEIDGNISAIVSLGSGNRSLPVSEKRSKADAIYTFIDKDITKPRSVLYGTNNNAQNSQPLLQTQNLTVNNLTQLTFANSDKDIKTKMISGQTQGWYYPLTTWIDDNGNRKTATGLKSFNELDALGGYLFATVYNPAAIITGQVSKPALTTTTNTSEHKCGTPPPPPPPVSGGAMKGVTQRLLMCLPFGNCANNLENPTVNDFGKIPAVDIGIGIIDNIITQGNQELTGTLLTDCVGNNCGKTTPNKLTEIPSSPDVIGFDTTPVLNPRAWWEK